MPEENGRVKARVPGVCLSHILRQFITKFRQKENKNGSLSYFYKDRAPYSADPKKCSPEK